MSANQSVKLVLAVAGFCLAMVATADARIRKSELADPHKDFTQRGFQIYAGLGGQDYEVEDADYAALDQLDDAGSFFLGVGLGISDKASLYLEGNASEHPTLIGDQVFGTALVGIKYAPNSGHSHRWQPYGKFGLGGMALLEDDSHHGHHHDDANGYIGPAASLALGVDHFIGRRTAIFGEIGVTSGQLDTHVIDDQEYELMDEIDVTSSRIQFGLRFRL